MKVNYFYKKTASIQKKINQLEILKKVFEFLPDNPEIRQNLYRQSLLKSSLFSARIEGNKLELKDIQFSPNNSKNLAKKEIFNILRALNYIQALRSPKKITKKLILKLHQMVLDGISSTNGLRREQSGIFNQAGIAVYLAPSANYVPGLLDKLIEGINSSEDNAIIKAAIFHFTFEKIHPFIDGNGRVGRLLSVFIFKNSEYSFRNLISIEEYLEENRQDYYDLLSSNKKEITEFVEFFLNGLISQAEKTLKSLKEAKRELPEDSLLPRRREILEIIKDQKMVSFNMIKRRFLKIPESTLHYDLKQLLKKKFIKKLGSTKGSFYCT